MTQTKELTVKEVIIGHYQPRDLLGIGESKPTVSWKVATTTKDWKQKSYEIRVTDGETTLYNGGKESDESAFVPWPAAPLESRQRVQVAVRVQGTDGSGSDWSQPVTVEAGLLSNKDWTARFVSATEPKDEGVILLRKEFDIGSNQIKWARLYVTAKGVYEVELNGSKVGDEVLAPGWTSYQNRIVHQTHDVTHLLASGANAIGGHIADGWFCGRLGTSHGCTPKLYGPKTSFLAQLEITFADGSSKTIATDGTWTWSRSPIQFASLYDGESYDANEEIPEWSKPGHPDGKWSAVDVGELGTNIEGPLAPPVRNTGILRPVEIFKSKSGKTIIDFGQNLVGVVRMSNINASKGHVITIKHAEVMEDDELGTRPLRTARATDTYTAKGTGNETYMPRFTFHGFRYAQIDNWPGSLSANDLEAVVQHTDFAQTGWFETSNPDLNRLHANAQWSMRGNFLSVPTDCPQRNERLGWTGDLSMFSPTANFLYSCQGMLKNWLSDFRKEQKEFGVPPVVCPYVLESTIPSMRLTPIGVWEDAVCLVPWYIYRATGDKSVLETQFDSMKDWIDMIPRDKEGALWDDSWFQYGDWLDPAAPPSAPAKGKTDPVLVANAFLIQSTRILAETARILGAQADADKYAKMASVQQAAFEKEYVTPNGRVVCESQTSYAIAIMFDLLHGDLSSGDSQLSVAGRALAKVVEKDQYNIATGFVGTPVICDALVKIGRLDMAYKMLLTKTCPSWLYPITMGATTVWERWDSMLPNGKINPGKMTSFNHYSLGAVADWMHRTIGGLNASDFGWKRILVRPRPGGELTHATTKYESPYGTVSSAWKLDGPQFTLDVAIPPNTTADVVLPTGETAHVGSGHHHFAVTL